MQLNTACTAISVSCCKHNLYKTQHSLYCHSLGCCKNIAYYSSRLHAKYSFCNHPLLVFYFHFTLTIFYSRSFLNFVVLIWMFQKISTA